MKPQTPRQEAIQVVARIRPRTRTEIDNYREIIAIGGGGQPTVTVYDPDTEGPDIQKKEFTFDAVYGPLATQAEVFQRPASIVESVLSGCNGTIFAYGQTGAGKSFTIRGADSLPGILPRTGRMLFSRIAEISGSDDDTIRHTFKVKMSFLQIYNEKIIDLFVRGQQRDGLLLKEDPVSGTFVKDLTWVSLSCAEDLEVEYAAAMQNLLIECTMMGAISTRMDNICTVVVECVTEESGVEAITRTGKLTIVDMAGSERQKSGPASGSTLKEATRIGRSLPSLGSVVHALIEKIHVPYRDSKLTRLLRDSFGGNTRTLMIANINPTDFMETMGTLKFASRVKYVQNKIRANVESYPALHGDANLVTASLPSTSSVGSVVEPDRSGKIESVDALHKRNLLLEKMIAVCVPDEALVRKLESSAVWNEEKEEWSIPVHYAAKVLSDVKQADVVDVCGTNGVCDEDTDWVVIEEKDEVGQDVTR